MREFDTSVAPESSDARIACIERSIFSESALVRYKAQDSTSHLGK